MVIPQVRMVAKKRFAGLTLISALLFSTVAVAMLFGTAQAQTTPKPSVPEFTVKLVDASYDEPITYSIDPYTGETITHGGIHIELTGLKVNVTNQPFTPTNQYDKFLYNIRIKGAFTEDWIELYRASDGYPTQSDTEYTVISLGLLREDGLDLQSGAKGIKIPYGGQVDFQVEAMIGYVTRVTDPNATSQLGSLVWSFVGEKSGWSSTQTLFIDEGQAPSPSPSPQPIPVPGESLLTVESNSSISELFFSSANSELSFTVNGTTGTAGYVKLAIAKSLMASVQNVKVFLDDTELEAVITSDEGAWFLSFNYMHSMHYVRINLPSYADTSIVPGIEIRITIGIITIIIVAFIGIWFLLKKRVNSETC